MSVRNAAPSCLPGATNTMYVLIVALTSITVKYESSHGTVNIRRILNANRLDLADGANFAMRKPYGSGPQKRQKPNDFRDFRDYECWRRFGK